MIEIFGATHADEMSRILSVSSSCDEAVCLGKVLLVVISIVLILHMLSLKNSKLNENF